MTNLVDEMNRNIKLEAQLQEMRQKKMAYAQEADQYERAWEDELRKRRLLGWKPVSRGVPLDSPTPFEYLVRDEDGHKWIERALPSWWTNKGVELGEPGFGIITHYFDMGLIQEVLPPIPLKRDN